jgi:hypothetical protein
MQPNARGMAIKGCFHAARKMLIFEKFDQKSEIVVLNSANVM